MFLRHLTSILQNFCTVIYFIFDHKVCLTELNILPIEQIGNSYEKSMQFYFLQNLLGILKNICCIAVSIIQSKDNKDIKKLIRTIKHYSFDLIRCFLDCLVSLHFWKNKLSKRFAGVIGVVTSIMAIMQSLESMWLFIRLVRGFKLLLMKKLI